MNPDNDNEEKLIVKGKNEEIVNKILPLKTEFDNCLEKIENLINNNQEKKNNQENKKYLLKLRDILMIKNVNSNNDLETYIFFSILHFYALSEINGILFSLLEEIKKSAHYLFTKDSEYNKEKNFYDFFLDLVLYDSSQINFNYLSSILSNKIINLIDVTPTYIVSTACNTMLLILLYFFHLSELNEERDIEIIYFCKMGSFFLLIYLFTGIIGLLPFYLLENKNNPKNIVVGNFCLFLGVIIKNALHFLFIYLFDNELYIYWIKAGFSVLFSIGYIIFLWKKNPKKKYDEIYEYSIGKLTVIKAFSTITLKFQKFKEYISSFLSTPSVIYLLILNFTSRTQKIVFKSKYKVLYDEGWLMLLNFFVSFVIYFLLMIYYFCREAKEISIEKIEDANFLEEKEEKNEEELKEEEEEIEEDNKENNIIINTENNSKKKNKKNKKIKYSSRRIKLIIQLKKLKKLKLKRKIKKRENRKKKEVQIKNDIKKNLNKIKKQKIKNKNLEKYIFKLILAEHFISLGLSISFWIFDFEPLILILIMISGAINFIYNDFYAIKTVQYLSVSGFMSINQILLRVLEILYSVFKSDYWMILQISVSIVGIIFVYLYKCQCLEKSFPCLEPE